MLWAGSVYDLVPPGGLKRAEVVLEEIHRRGVVHGDVRSHTMAYDPETGRVAPGVL